MSMKKPALSIAVLSLTMLISRTGLAEDAATGAAAESTPGAARPKLSEEALALYKARDYRHAAEKFLQAYSLDHDSNLLFNIARCYEALGDTDGAVEKYEAFLATPDADVEGRRRAALAIRTLRQSTSGSVPSAPSPAASNPDSELAATGRTHAGSSAGERYTALSAEALAFYKAGEYRRSSERFLQAYAFDPDPNLIFNVARCYAALGDTAAAIEKYEAFLNAPGADLNGRKHAQANLRKLRQTPTVALQPTNEEHGDLPAEPQSNRTRIVVGWAATALLTAGTVVTGVLALDSARKLKTARETFPSNGPDLASRASRTTTLTLSADALGIGSALMGGLSLYWTLSEPSASASSELKVSIGPRSLRVVGSF
jgi:tetratricopeptide (TPR) repeat protein